VSRHNFPRQISSRAVLLARACLKKFHRSSPESSRSTTNPRKLCVLPKTFWRTTSGSKATTKRRPVSLRVHRFARNTFPSDCRPGPSDFSFAGNAGAASYNFDGDASM
jgi:hypothetical protein